MLKTRHDNNTVKEFIGGYTMNLELPIDFKYIKNGIQSRRKEDDKSIKEFDGFCISTIYELPN